MSSLLLKQQAENLKLPFVTTTIDIQGRQIHDDEVLFEAAKKRGMILFNDGLLLVSNVSDNELVNMRNLAQRAGVVTSVSMASVETIQSLLDQAEKNTVGTKDYKKEQKLTPSNAMTRLKGLLSNGQALRASDIHFDLRANECFVKMRIMGKLVHFPELTLTRVNGDAVANVAIRVLSNKDFSFNKAESGTFYTQLEAGQTRMRANYQPVVGGGDLVLRYLSMSGGSTEIPGLIELGLGRLNKEIIESALRSGTGVILISGPTGSGKTTTLNSAINGIPDDQKTYTIEDPVEMINPKISQIEIKANAEDKHSAEKGFADAQENVMRQDPDNVMLGEVRNRKVAETVIHLGTTGHMAIATIHTNSAIAILTRLNDLGIEWTRLADPSLLKVLIFQRLASTLCDVCKKPISQIGNNHPYVKDKKLNLIKKRIDSFLLELKEAYDSEPEHKDAPFYPYVKNMDGCDNCTGGIKGRTTVVELIKVTQKVREFIKVGDMSGLEVYIKSTGWESLAVNATHLVRRGVVDPYDVDGIVGGLSSQKDEVEFNYSDQRRKISDRFRASSKTVFSIDGEE